ncbi:MAG: LysM peptidoglycan-binding domain-containing protein [Candidatus Moranbacteria bacterium]|nr:LysM peptidoglycan-binding domain-containing protein [Candidatus Moranbacteria bacterium]
MVHPEKPTGMTRRELLTRLTAIAGATFFPGSPGKAAAYLEKHFLSNPENIKDGDIFKVTYKIKAGDNISNIAQKFFGRPPFFMDHQKLIDKIIQTNEIDPEHLQINQEIVIPLEVCKWNQRIKKQVIASWYGDPKKEKDDFAYQETASGLPMRPDQLTAAHPDLPLGSIVEVTPIKNPSCSFKVVITDRGPYHQERGIDLSFQAAEKIPGMLKKGTANVNIKFLSMDPNYQKNFPELLANISKHPSPSH